MMALHPTRLDHAAELILAAAGDRKADCRLLIDATCETEFCPVGEVDFEIVSPDDLVGMARLSGLPCPACGRTLRVHEARPIGGVR